MRNDLIDGKLWLAPLAGVTDKPFRQIAKLCGADVLVSEMVSADGLIYASKKTREYLVFDEIERPFGIQLFTAKPEVMEKAVKLVTTYRPDFIDINMGCPVTKVVKKGAGSALMKTPSLAREILLAAKNATDLPVSVKFRSGWDQNSLNYLDFGLMLAEAGADFLILHPRTRSQMFAGKANWEHIALLKKQLKIPLIGNGDILHAEDAQSMYNLTACSGIMVGRGAYGAPWIFTEIKNTMQNMQNRIDKLEIIKKHFYAMLVFKGDNAGMKEMRGHFCQYTKGIKGGSLLREFINHSMEKDEIIRKVEEMYG